MNIELKPGDAALVLRAEGEASLSVQIVHGDNKETHEFIAGILGTFAYLLANEPETVAALSHSVKDDILGDVKGSA